MFEGVFDLLSTLVYYGKDRPGSNVLVLNSVGMAERAIECLNGQGVKRLHTYLDHDQAGDHLLALLREREPWNMHDASAFYLGFKDVNEFLKDRKERERGDDRDR